MTRTEDDLRTLLQLPVEAAVVDRVVASTISTPRSAERAHTRRPGRIALVAALAVVLVVGVAAAVVAARPEPRTSLQPPIASTAGVAPSTLTVAASVVSFPDGSPFRVTSTYTYGDGETVGVVRTDDAASRASISVTEPGGPVGGLRVGGRPPVDLPGGRTGYWVYTDSGAAVGPTGDSLTWTTGPGLAVVVRPPLGDATDGLVSALAEAVQIGAARPIRVPVSSTSWPTDWTMTGLQSRSTAANGTTPVAGRDVLIEIQLPGSRQSDVTIEVTNDPGYIGHGGDGTPVVIAGRTWGLIPTANVFSWRSTDWTVRVMATNGAGGHRTVTDAQLQTFIGGLTIATSFSDESTWFDATSALPS